MRQIGAAFGFQPNRRYQAVYLPVELREPVPRDRAGEQGAARSLIEKPDSLKSKLDRGRVNPGQAGGDVLGDRPFDFSDVPQRDVKLLVRLPGPARRPVRDRFQASLTEFQRRTECDEQPMHGQPLVERARARDRFSLNKRRTLPIYRDSEGLSFTKE
jgi:hypothetical protein